MAIFAWPYCDGILPYANDGEDAAKHSRQDHLNNSAKAACNA
jgi:hypothetical protein